MAVKNFKAPVAKKEILSEKITVEDFMIPRAKLITFFPTLTIVEAMQTLMKNNISGAPIVDENDHILGIISERDCIKKIADSRYYNIPLYDQTVYDYMRKEFNFIDKASMNIFDAANKFCATKDNRFPVLEGKKVIGQISRKDILKAALKIM